jgi:hypothetical protein
MKRTKDSKNRLPVVIPYTIYRKLLKQPHNTDLIALYSFYLHISNWQGTNQPRATDTFCMNNLSFGLNRFYQAKKVLVQLKLIEQIRDRKTANNIGKCYIKIIEKSHSMENNRAREERAFVSDLDEDGMAPTNQKQALYGFQQCRKQETNAYKEKKNALNVTTPGGSSRKDVEIGSTNSKIDDPKLTERNVCPYGHKFGDIFAPSHRDDCRKCKLADECDLASFQI